MIILLEAHKSFHKIHYPFIMRTPKKLGIEGNMFNMIKDIYEKPTVNIILNVEQIKTFSLILGMRQGCPFLLLLCNILLVYLARGIRQEEEIKSIQTGKEKVKLSLFIDHMILYIKIFKRILPVFSPAFKKLGSHFV